MLTELRINNFAIIDHLEMHFGPGLITFTGETGAGKSILIDAVETLLGGRAEFTMVRSGDEQAIIEGRFYLSPSVRASVNAILEREDLLDEPDHIFIGREIRVNGRNVARLNGRSVSAGLLREVGEFLVDVHGQSEHLSLLRVSQHLRLLDSYAASGENNAIEGMKSAYQATYNRLQSTREELARLRQAESDAARQADLLSYQIDEIQAARLQPGEEDELVAERNRLANAEDLATYAQEALTALDEGDPEIPAASDLFGQVVEALAALARLDPDQSELHERAQLVAENINDLSLELRDYIDTIEYNPKRLNQVEERLGLIHNLKRKYGGNVEEVLRFLTRAQDELDAITHAGERIQELEKEEADLLSRLGQQATALSEKRRYEAENLSRNLVDELADLNMDNTRFAVDFQHRPDPSGVPLEDGRRAYFDATGIDRVEFLIEPNPGEGLKPLAKIASGGETSRLMLALKNVLTSADNVPTLIFDEIDQGIGGRVGAIVGHKLWRLSNEHQVFCVTHLPQLAAFGRQHFHVQKKLVGSRTITQVELLEGQSRLSELASMLGGISEGTLRSAQEIMEAARIKAGSVLEPFE
jgi:DNA repair protein RecN (Recombination protein N)